jgi:hypothetical protein
VITRFGVVVAHVLVHGRPDDGGAAHRRAVC